MQRVDTNQSVMSCPLAEHHVEYKPLPPPPPPRSLSTPLNSPFVKPLFVLPRQDSGRRFSTGTGNVVYVNVKRSRYSSDPALPQYSEDESGSSHTTTTRTTVRASESGKRVSLPQWSEEEKDSSVRVAVRASDSGKGFVLPLTIAPPPPAVPSTPARKRTASSPNVKREVQSSASDGNAVSAVPPPPPPGVQSRSNSDASTSSSSSAPDDSTFADPTDRSGRLRRRTVHASEADMAGHKESRERSSRSPSPKPTSRREKMGGIMMTFLHLLQVIAIFTIFCLVYDSHSKMNMAAVRLKDYKDGFLTFGMEAVVTDHANTLELHQNRLLQIGDELHRTIRTIQKQVQDAARQQIVQTFGEGPVQVALDLEFFTEGPSRIIIQFFEETPHTAWNWLEQVSRQAWDGAQFMWHAPHVIQAVPPRANEAPATFNFTEIPPGNHQTYTVGLTKASSGALNIYINLQDNSAHHFDDACVGKVVDGFDALKRLLEVPETNSALDHPVTIKSVTALPRQQAAPAVVENANAQAELHVS